MKIKGSYSIQLGEKNARQKSSPQYFTDTLKLTDYAN